MLVEILFLLYPNILPRLAPELERAGSHIIELGIPFSDPVADGPTIQRAGARAFASSRARSRLPVNQLTN